MSSPNPPSPNDVPVPSHDDARAPDGTTTLRWSYPFLAHDKTEVTNPQVYYDALSRMIDGFYPLGANGFPHGGIHFGQGSDSTLDQASGVRCVLDGEVIAYRLNDTDLQLHYTYGGRQAGYSNGFVLVRHTLTLPPAPTTPAGTPPAAGESQVLYSLYMHQASWTRYLANPAMKRPSFWKGNGAFRVGRANQQTAPDDDAAAVGAKGSFVHQAPTADRKGRLAVGEVVGFLPEGSEVRIGEQRHGWGHIQHIVAGGMISPVVGQALGSDDHSVPWESDRSAWASAGEAPTTTATTAAGDYGWLRLSDQVAVIEPSELDTVVSLDPPTPVKAGTLLGHLGEYQRFREATPLPPVPRRAMLHVEVFAGDGFEAFLATSRTRAAQLSADQRTLLVLSPGALLLPKAAPADTQLKAGYKLERSVDSPSHGIWVKIRTRQIIPPGTSMAAFGPLSTTALWIERSQLQQPSAGLPVWTSFPLRLAHVKAPANNFPLVLARPTLDGLDETARAVDEHGVQWWRVTYGTSDGTSAIGWVCEKDHPGTQWQSPSAWPGFDIVDATGISLTDCFKRNLSIVGDIEPLEQQHFKPAVASVNGSALLLKLENAVDVQGDGHGQVTGLALQQALRKPWLAQGLAHVILKYQSEWGGPMSRWDALTALMKDCTPTWANELERIHKLQWWHEVANKVPGFPADPTVYHMHPIGLVGNFLADCTCINIEAFCKKYKEQHSQEFGWFDQHGNHQNLPPLNGASETNLNELLNEMMVRYSSYFKKCNNAYIAYMLATVRIESYDFRRAIFFGPILESISSRDAEDNYGVGPGATARHKVRAISMGNTDAGDGYKYRGRGLVQLTFKKNYKRFNDEIDVDLVNYPDKALELPSAVKIMMLGMRDGIFSGLSMSYFLDSNPPDYLGARAIINGSDKASQFKFYAEKFEKIIKDTK